MCQLSLPLVAVALLKTNHFVVLFRTHFKSVASSTDDEFTECDALALSVLNNDF